MDMTGIAVEVKNINKLIDDQKVLNNVSFKLVSGHITALLGPNGSGKTTTLKILSNLINYDSGKIVLNNEIQQDHKNIMIVFDEPILYDELTGLEHLDFIIELNNIEIKETEKMDYIKTFELEQSIKKVIYTYSYGTKKKLQLLCTLINNPKILLLDEYISGLDPLSLYNIKQILKGYVSKGNTVLLATHMLDVAEKFCDDVIMINKGGVVNSDILSIDEVRKKFSSLEAFYINSINNFKSLN